ncbi:hypothetical protein L1987_35367 [Smallanthus sonchifolius]|uniref:Uncharacterized protein n=1 Tax=Smallanthus sonchifolius TaxID=185202 RepID=A0ACB9HY63_9ASTR|nr:hypothetical protein L1987_35367 [Smallanthus sonchifolius]
MGAEVTLESYFGDSENIVSLLSEEEQQAAEESFSVYYRPIEFYNILESRASDNPSFLKRCLHYKLKDKHKRRVQLSVSISRPLDDGPQTPSIFPLYVLLARPVPTPNGETQRSSCYRFKRACKWTASNGAQTAGSWQARFILPDINKLSTEFKSGSLAILLVHFADIINQTEIDLTEDHVVSRSNEGYCLMANSPIDFIHFSRENSPKISPGERAEFISNVSLKSCYMKLSSSDGEKRVSTILKLCILQQVPITITAEELGAKDLSPLDLHSYNNMSTDKLPEVLRQRTGEVSFNYKYYNNMLQRTEVTEDYTCPFCYLKCASYKVFAFEYKQMHSLWNLKKTNVNFHSHRAMRRKKSDRQNQNHEGPLVLESNMRGVPSAAANIRL